MIKGLLLAAMLLPATSGWLRTSLNTGWRWGLQQDF